MKNFRTAVPVIGWDATQEEWLEARQTGLGGSDVTSALGMSRYRSPYEVWRERCDENYVVDTAVPSEAAALGHALEPWLVEQAAQVLDVRVHQTPDRSYGHVEHTWRRCSPDAVTVDGRLVECKTAGIAAGFGTPPGWGPGELPLAYELQVRWSMHVMDARAAEVIALVANKGLIRRTVQRDLVLEAELVHQVSQWWKTHVEGKTKPAMGAEDNDLLKQLFPTPTKKTIDLSGTDADVAWERYLAAREREKDAKKDKEHYGARLKQLLGEYEKAQLDGMTIATWAGKKGNVDWKRLIDDLRASGVEVPNPEQYRKADSRSLDVKGA